MQLRMEETTTNQVRTGSVERDSAGSNRFPALLTVGQASQYLHAQGLDRTTKTIRKWCRLEHVETKSNTIPGGPKWLIVRTSLDAKIEEEKVIEAALKQKTGSHPFEPVRPQTSSNQSEPVYDNQLVQTLAQQIIEKDKQLANAHSREIEPTKIIASQNEKHHELARDMAQLGITIGNALRLNSGNTGSNRSAQDRTEEVRARLVEDEAPQAPPYSSPQSAPASTPQPQARTTPNHEEPVVRLYEEPEADVRSAHRAWGAPPAPQTGAQDRAPIHRWDDEFVEEPDPSVADEERQAPRSDASEIEYPPRYGSFRRDAQGDNAPADFPYRGVQ